MSLEHNRDRLKRAIEQLPSHAPPAGVWANIDRALDRPVAPDETVLREAVGQLPGHTPPTSVWNHLTKELDRARADKKLRVVRRRRVLGWAAALALLVTAGVLLLREPGPNVRLEYGQETVAEFAPAAEDWNEEQAVFAQLEARFDRTDNPVVNKLRFEYEELTEAHDDIAAMLRSYGRDPRLIRQMADIERERDDIYRRVIDTR